MRLSTIKLSGFKSFVDATTVHMPTNLIGVVGPNGCGKSNIIDAVRWVMGESSPKQLRGESMSDVIFSGSNTRQPVGTATIELIFDNSDGAVQGEYANFNEISVKRQVSRDGQSQYSLNGARCRRRDITDLFLGTGLGVRSYSIIEQGMISKLVEARPEELRVHLEEAAGISKYKERRRETERRIKHTRENLERLHDLREEVDKQLQHLKRQARAAERYKKLKVEQREKQAQLLLLKWQGLEHKSEARREALALQENKLESGIADLRARESEIEAAREQQAGCNDDLNEAQKKLYEVGSEIARIEQMIQHNKDLQSRARREQEEAEAQWREVHEHIALDQVQIEDLRQLLSDLEPQLEAARATSNEAADQLLEAEGALAQWQDQWESFSIQSGEKSQAAEVEKTRIDHLDRQLSSNAQRLKTLEEERIQVDTAELESQLGDLRKQDTELADRGNDLQQQLGVAKSALDDRLEEIRRTEAQLADAAEKVRTGKGRLSSLEALQQSALGQDQESMLDWLASQNMAELPRLAQKIQVQSGWETAVEAALGDSLEAVVVPRLSAQDLALASLESGQVQFVSQQGADSQATPPDSLASVVNGPAVINELLGKVRLAENLAEAFDLAPHLGAGESVVTREGEWLGQGWLRVSRTEDARHGVLAREKEIKSLYRDIEASQADQDKFGQELDEHRAAFREAQATREELQTAADNLIRRHAEVRGQLDARQSRIDHLGRRAQRIAEESQSLREQIDSDETHVRGARGRLEESLGEMADLQTRREALEARRTELEGQRKQCREAARTAQAAAHELALSVESKRAARHSTEQALERLSKQRSQLDVRRKELLEQVEISGEPLAALETELKTYLDQRIAADETVAQARKALEQASSGVREHEQARSELDEKVQSEREELERCKLSLQEVKVMAKTLGDQLQATGFTHEQLAETLPENADETAWEEMLEKLERRIVRLEPVNLAAIKEFEEQSERKEYLDSQDADLREALETLEGAIHKIDRKTRTRFKETFDKVNSGLQALFPRLFGGGHAYLELTDDDLLTTGVAVMARPPGKRVTSIHLLSGGEKALTAVAMVFAIFELNPAPFCMLDEVDAPLDDANVGRFSQLVREMSEQVQFVFVTHNKITMEIAHQLVGVTMREPGVSRLVSVDIAEAEQLAAS